jgi:hypothetical protein
MLTEPVHPIGTSLGALVSSAKGALVSGTTGGGAAGKSAVRKTISINMGESPVSVAQRDATKGGRAGTDEFCGLRAEAREIAAPDSTK